MGAWVAQVGAEGYWLKEGMGGSGLQQYADKPSKSLCGFDSGGLLCAKEEEEDEEESRRRMVELMLGPCNYLFNNAQQRLHVEEQRPSTLDLLNAPPSSGRSDSSSSGHVLSMDSTPIELEADYPLPSGWEKCLDLKTGNIYYVNRSTGANSSVDPRKSPLCHGKSGRAGLNSWHLSPATSEVTTEASSRITAKQVALNNTEKCEGNESALDLNLSLHVGQSPAKLPPQPASLSVKACSPLHSCRFKVPSSVPSVSSSSSSITSPQINTTFPFSHSIASTKETMPCPSQDIDCAINKQYLLWPAPRESRFINSDCLFSDQRLQKAETVEVSESGGHASPTDPMVTVACANCLMFVMLSRSNPKCPRCGICPGYIDFPQPPLKRAKLGFSL